MSNQFFSLYFLSGNIGQEQKLEPEAGAGTGAKIREKLEPEPKWNNFGSATLQKSGIFWCTVFCLISTADFKKIQTRG